MADFDYAGYTKSLEKVLESTQKDYWAQYIDINRHQVNVGRTYLWVSAALIGAYAAGYKQFESIIADHFVFYFFLFSILLSVIAFGICLYAIPARKGYKSVHKEGWGEFSHIAYNLLSLKNENLYTAFLTDFISKFDTAHRYSFETNQKRARLLRITSWFLIVSFSCSIFSFVIIGTMYKRKPTMKENFMSETSDSSTGQGAGNQPANTETPNVPVPPPPAGSQGSQIHTHSDESPTVIITEGAGGKTKK